MRPRKRKKTDSTVYVTGCLWTKWEIIWTSNIEIPAVCLSVDDILIWCMRPYFYSNTEYLARRFSEDESSPENHKGK